MQIQFLGAAQTVTGSKYLLTFNGKRVLLDCGLFRGMKEWRLRNWEKFHVAPSQIDAVILTHAHIDHSGYLPVLVKQGFMGKIFCTPATKELCNILLPDSGFLQERDTEYANVHGYSKHHPALPLYTRADAEHTLTHFISCDFERQYDICGLNVCFKHVGHILGAAMVTLRYQDKTLLFSGDVGRMHDEMMYPPINLKKVAVPDYLFLESTYGNRLHGTDNPTDKLGEIINRVAARGGTMVIPAFAVGRTQNILSYIYHLKEQHKIPDLPVFVDSPMAKDVTDLWAQFPAEHRLSREKCAKIFCIAKYTNSVEDSKLIDSYNFPKIIISASGMATGGRVLHHLQFFISDKRNLILFVGHQECGTRGDLLIKGASEIKLLGGVMRAAAEIAELPNVSAHADYQEILDWLHDFAGAPRQTFIVHGEPQAALALKSKIEDLYHWHCVVPKYLEQVVL